MAAPGGTVGIYRGAWGNAKVSNLSSLFITPRASQGGCGKTSSYVKVILLNTCGGLFLKPDRHRCHLLLRDLSFSFHNSYPGLSTAAHGTQGLLGPGQLFQVKKYP